MANLTAILWTLALYAGITIGPGGRMWTWGIAILLLGLAQVSAIVAMWRDRKPAPGIVAGVVGLLVSMWFGWRSSASPVRELAEADGILLATAVGSFVCWYVIAGCTRAGKTGVWGIAVAILGNLAVSLPQLRDTAFSPILPRDKPTAGITGFFTHYNEFANFLVAAAAMTGAAAFFGNHQKIARCLLGITAVLGFIAIYFTHSRGGILAGIIALPVLLVLALIAGRNQMGRWFGAVAVVLPIALILLAGGLIVAWESAQAARGGSEAISDLLDNHIRLYMVGLAVATIGNHPLLGGGSRSYSWECYQFVKPETSGAMGNRPEFVHNEFLQAATDYGMIGAALLAGLLLFAAGNAIYRSTTAADADRSGTWLWIGGIAALAGMLVQSCFSFVFHLFPGTLLLGGALAMTLHRPVFQRQSFDLGSRLLLTTSALAATFVLLGYGWKGAQLTAILEPVYLNRFTTILQETKIEKLDEANEIWPAAALLGEQAAELQIIAESAPEISQISAGAAAAEKYREAIVRHPLDPSLRVNRANLLSAAGHNAEAEKEYTRAGEIEGGMEAAFAANYHTARHFYRRGLREMQTGDLRNAIASLERAADDVNTSIRKTQEWSLGTQDRVRIHIALGNALEKNGDNTGAMELYEKAAGFPAGTSANYAMAVLLAQKADNAWAKRDASTALKWFLEARAKLSLVTDFPPGVTAEIARQFTEFIDHRIKFLREAKIEPEE